MEEFFTNPWFIGFIVINIAALIFLGIRFYLKNKRDEPLLFERLKDAEINIQINKPIHSTDSNQKTTID